MKNIIKLRAITALVLLIGLWACQKDINPEINPIEIAEDDLIQVSNNRNFVPVIISTGESKNVDKIVVNIIKDGATDVIATNTLKNVTNNNLNRVVINVPFPLPSVAPSGKYNVEYTIEDEDGKKETKAYKVNIQNNQIVGCSGKIEPSSGNNLIVELNLTNPAVQAFTGDTYQDIYITGSFEGWTGGDEGKPQYKFTKTSNTCYYVEVNMPSGAEFKITRGDWPREIKGADGNTPSNYKFNGEKFIKIDVYNWADKPVVNQTPNPPSNVTVLPFEAIQTGKTTVVVDVNSTNAAPKYYLVKKGATTLDGAIPMFKVDASTKIAGAVPKGSTDEYVVVKDVIAKTGVNGFGYEVPVKITGDANPFVLGATIGGFKTEYNPPFPTTELLFVGGASPAGWNNSGSNPQKFTQTAPGKFTITLELGDRGSGGYLIIPVIGNWDSKIGRASGNATAGTLSFGSSDFLPPTPLGNYKVDVDLIAGTYTLTKLP
jgi:hypothetical protein